MVTCLETSFQIKGTILLSTGHNHNGDFVKEVWYCISLCKGFLKGIVESRHNKKSSKEVATTDIDTGHVSTSTNRTEDKKRKRFGKPHEKNGLMEHREMKRVKKHIPNNHRTNELRTSGGDGFKRTYKGRQSRVKSNKDPSERSGKTNKEKYSKGPASGFKRKMDSTNTRKDAAASPRPCTSSKSLEHKKVGRKH
ncbi:hypothetical protein ACFX12_014412 [Malus domestica]